ncbi:sulfate permease 2 [Colletotrichum tofieldiae]|nr:sulfate permease 2 [Colletotrichum tofieldiae]
MQLGGRNAGVSTLLISFEQKFERWRQVGAAFCLSNLHGDPLDHGKNKDATIVKSTTASLLRGGLARCRSPRDPPGRGPRRSATVSAGASETDRDSRPSRHHPAQHDVAAAARNQAADSYHGPAVSKLPGVKTCRGSSFVDMELPGNASTEPVFTTKDGQCYNLPGTAQCGIFMGNKADGCEAKLFRGERCTAFSNVAVFQDELRPVGGFFASMSIKCGIVPVEPKPLSLGASAARCKNRCRVNDRGPRGQWTQRCELVDGYGMADSLGRASIVNPYTWPGTAGGTARHGIHVVNVSIDSVHLYSVR